MNLSAFIFFECEYSDDCDDYASPTACKFKYFYGNRDQLPAGVAKLLGLSFSRTTTVTPKFSFQNHTNCPGGGFTVDMVGDVTLKVITTERLTWSVLVAFGDTPVHRSTVEHSDKKPFSITIDCCCE